MQVGQSFYQYSLPSGDMDKLCLNGVEVMNFLIALRDNNKKKRVIYFTCMYVSTKNTKFP